MHGGADLRVKLLADTAVYFQRHAGSGGRNIDHHIAGLDRSGDTLFTD